MIFNHTKLDQLSHRHTFIKKHNFAKFLNFFKFVKIIATLYTFPIKIRRKNGKIKGPGKRDELDHS